MGGRAKEKCYQYNKEGKFLKEWESQSSLVNSYNITKGNFYNTKGYKVLSDNTYVFPNRSSKRNIARIHKIENCKFCNIKPDSRQRVVEVYNLLNEKIAEFTSLAALEKLTGIPRATALQNATGEHKRVREGNNLIFKFKNQ